MPDVQLTTEQLLAELAALRAQAAREQALARVRDVVRRMASHRDLGRVAAAVRQALLELGIGHRNCEINLLDSRDDPRSVVAHGTNALEAGPTTDAQGPRSDTVIGFWRAQDVVYRRDLSAEDPHGEEELRAKGVRSVIDVPFSHGTLALNSLEPDAFSPGDIQTLRAVAEVLSEAFRRLEGLRKVEERNEELEGILDERQQTERRRQAVSRIREQVWRMEEDEDLPRVLDVVGDALRDAGMAYRDCDINLVDATDESVRHYDPQRHAWVEVPEGGAVLIVQMWRQGTVSYRPHLDREDSYGDAARIQKVFGHPVRSVVDVPFSAGTLAVNSDRPEAFSEADLDLLREVAEVLSEGIQRARDLSALRQSEERYRQLVENAPVCIHEIDREGRLMSMNQAGLEMIGLGSEAGIRGRAYLDCVAGEERERIGDLLDRAWEGEPAFFQFRAEIEGRSLFLDSSCIPLRDSRGNVVRLMGVARDLTQRRRMERELIRLERLRAVGELAAGISHNLNNMLVGVMGPAQLLQRFSEDPLVLEQAGAILSAATRASDLVRQLNHAVRGKTRETLRAVRLNEAVVQAIEAARPRWRDESQARGVTIQVVTELHGAGAVRGTQTDLHDLLLNLLFNAVDAMPRGGTLTLRTRDVEEGIQLTVADTGIGMDEETRRRVFEPFFTTKMDVGTGLGLSTVYGTVSRWGGRIEVESAPGRGTTFTVLFPAAAGSEAGEPAAATPAAAGRRGRLWIVEDDDTVADVLSRLLAAAHAVEVIRDGREAIERVEPGCCDVALIDLGLPGAPGDEVARRLRSADPSVVTVLITGWSLAGNDARLDGFDLRIQKPFDDLSEVEEIVTRALGRHAARSPGLRAPGV